MSVTAGSKFFGVTVPAGGSETVCLVDNDYDGFMGAELTLTNAALAGGGDKSLIGGRASMIGKALRSGVRCLHLLI